MASVDAPIAEAYDAQLCHAFAISALAIRIAARNIDNCAWALAMDCSYQLLNARCSLDLMRELIACSIAALATD